jgi:hypothetical protein
MFFTMLAITGDNGRDVVVRLNNAFKGMEGLDGCGDMH